MTVELIDVRAGYGPGEVLHGVTTGFPAGAVVALVGRNGAGKSTLLRCVAGLLRPRGGDVCWDGDSIAHLSSFARARAGMTMVPDEHGAFASMTVRENLELSADA